MKQIEINSFEQLLKIGHEAIQQLGATTWFRGVAKNSHKLVASVFRKDRPNMYERFLCGNFVLQAPQRHPNCPDKTDRGQWLTLMRHYNLPTRLLDWSKSILVAAYFAARRHPEHAATIWVLNPIELNRRQIGEAHVAALGSGGPITGMILNSAFDEQLIPSNTPAELRDQLVRSSEKIVAVAPSEIDARMMLQQSMMTIHGSAQPLENVAEAGTFLWELSILATAKTGILSTLQELGIRESLLFPDLEHLASDLSESVEADYQHERNKGDSFKHLKPAPLPPGQAHGHSLMQSLTSLGQTHSEFVFCGIPRGDVQTENIDVYALPNPTQANKQQLQNLHRIIDQINASPLPSQPGSPPTPGVEERT